MRGLKCSNRYGWTRVINISVALTATVLLIAACARPPIQEQAPTTSSRDLRKILGDRAIQWKRYQTALRLRSHSDRGSFAFRSIAFGELPHRFRLEVFNPLGHGVGLFTVDRFMTRLWLPAEQVVYTSLQPEPLLERMLGISFPFEALPYLMAATIQPEHLPSLEFESSAAGWVAVNDLKTEGVRYSYTFLSSPLSLSKVAMRRGLWKYEVHYDPPVELHHEAVPKRMTLSGIDWTLEVVVEKMEKSENLAHEVFIPQAPKGTRTVELVGQAQ